MTREGATLAWRLASLANYVAAIIILARARGGLVLSYRIMARARARDTNLPWTKYFTTGSCTHPWMGYVLIPCCPVMC